MMILKLINIKKLGFGIILASLFIQLVFTQQSFAQETSNDEDSLPVPTTGVNITLSPTFINLVADPGETVTASIRLTNNNNFTEYFQFETQTFEPSNDGDSPIIRRVKSDEEFAKWVSFSESKFTVAANQTKVLKIEIDTPEDARLGYYFAFVITRQNEIESENTASVAGGTATLALLEVRSENETRSLQIEDFKPGKLFYEYLPAELNIKVKNTGNIHVVPVGDMFIDSMTNKEVAVVPVNAGRGNILPQSTRTFAAIFEDGFAVRVPKTDKDGSPLRDRDGNTKYTTKFDFSKMDKFRIGKYDATVVLVYDNGERDVPIQATVSFWIIPWKLIGLGLVVLVLILLGLKSAIAPVFRRK